MADGRGFEPPLGFRPKRTFQARAFNHSATHPHLEKWSHYSRFSPKSQGLFTLNYRPVIPDKIFFNFLKTVTRGVFFAS